MNIARLDFFSEPPQLSYCKKETNKTFFGGILFFVYIAVMILISVVYIIDFFVNDKYDIKYSLIKNTEIDSSKMNEDIELNPNINMTIEIYKMSNPMGGKLSDKFVIIDEKIGLINGGEIFKRRVNETQLVLAYECVDFNCTLDENDYDPLGYLLELKYSGYKLDHQSTKIPLDVNEDKYFTERYPFFFNNPLINILKWEVIKYAEERGILGLLDKITGKKSEFTSGFISSSESYTIDHPIVGYIFGKVYKYLCIIPIVNEHYQYTEYKRVKKSFLDVLANIGALFSTLFSVFIFVYKYCSKNYDNYYLVDQILSSKKIRSLETQIKKTKKKKDIELASNILNEENNIDSNKESPLIGDVPDTKSLSINDNDNDNDNINNDNGDNEEEDIITNSKNLKFMDFILNNFYCGCCKKGNQAEIIDICNELLSKYISVDIILYHQIMMENLLKDYQWNDKKFSSLKSNDLIFKLNNLT